MLDVGLYVNTVYMNFRLQKNNTKSSAPFKQLITTFSQSDKLQRSLSELAKNSLWITRRR